MQVTNVLRLGPLKSDSNLLTSLSFSVTCSSGYWALLGIFTSFPEWVLCLPPSLLRIPGLLSSPLPTLSLSTPHQFLTSYFFKTLINVSIKSTANLNLYFYFFLPINLEEERLLPARPVTPHAQSYLPGFLVIFQLSFLVLLSSCMQYHSQFSKISILTCSNWCQLRKSSIPASSFLATVLSCFTCKLLLHVILVHSGHSIIFH